MCFMFLEGRAYSLDCFVRLTKYVTGTFKEHCLQLKNIKILI